MNQIGIYLEEGSIMIGKYGFNIPLAPIEKNITRLTNQLWKLIPMRENDENWEKQLDTVILEIAGLSEIFIENPQFLSLLAKLEGIKVEQVTFELYRKTVFESISLLRGLLKSETAR